MPAEAAPPGPLSLAGAILTAPMKIHRESGRIVLSQKTRLWFRTAVCLWASVVLMMPFLVYSQLFNSQTTHFTCDRGSGACAIDGRTRDVPRLADITRAQMDRDYNRRDGRNWGINLVTGDGKRHSIEQQRAIKDSVIADYRATVKAINAYLADPRQQQLDTSFTYRAGLSEKLQSIFYLFFFAAALYGGWWLWTRRAYTFDPGRVTVEVRRPFRHATQEIAAGRIVAIADRQVLDRRLIELMLDGTSPLPVVDAGRTEASMVGPLATELAALLGKPLQNAST